MLSLIEANQLNVLGGVPMPLQNPAFLEQRALWAKQDGSVAFSKEEIAVQRHEYIKIGKTFGFETTRFVGVTRTHLVYFDDASSAEVKGYCKLDNTYLQWLPLNTGRYLLVLANATEKSLFFFEQPHFWLSIRQKLTKQVVQLDFESKYQLKQQIGQGSFSKVFLVKSRSSKEEFAAKIVAKRDKHKACTRLIVMEEKKILGLLNSSHICKLEEFYQDQDHFIFILEYLPGKDLMTLFKEKAEIETRKVLELLRNILKGLQHCHENNVIHRDLKPQNIILSTPALHPKIIDFGLSLQVTKLCDAKSFKRCGTMGYMAPEVIANTAEHRKPYTSKCDVFSFGIIAHMILLGSNPLKGKNYEETLAKNKECEIHLDKERIVSMYGLTCLDFFQRVLAKQPAVRCSAADALRSEFLTDKEESSSTMEQIRRKSNKSCSSEQRE